MRTWHVLVVLAAVVVLAAGQTAWAQATTRPAGDAPADDAREPAGPTIGGSEKGDQPGDAKTQPAGGRKRGIGGDWQFFAVLIGGMALLWWWMGRSRRKQQQKQREMLDAIKKGDKVTSIGGIIGTVIEVKDKEIVVKVDESSNVRMKFLRSAIRNIGGAAAGEDSDQESRNK